MNSTTKILIRTALIVTALLVCHVDSYGQSCTPFEVQSQPDDLEGCLAISKEIHRTVVFPDSATFERSLQEDGRCENVYWCLTGFGPIFEEQVECWPQFYSPTILDFFWQRSARKRRALPTLDQCLSVLNPNLPIPYAKSATCVNDAPNVKSTSVWHTCPEASCPEQCGGGLYVAVDYCMYGTGCPSGFINLGDGCCDGGATPLIVDMAGDGFDFTDLSSGVHFDLDEDGVREELSWTARGSDDAWLALDRNGNSTIDGGQELFGNHTPQPDGPGKNGFKALAEYDLPVNGGNADGRIGPEDTVYPELLLWTDANHNGRSERPELRSVAESGQVVSINLEYEETLKRDRHGNWFRYRELPATNLGGRRGEIYDVFLLTNPLRTTMIRPALSPAGSDEPLE